MEKKNDNKSFYKCWALQSTEKSSPSSLEESSLDDSFESNAGFCFARARRDAFVSASFCLTKSTFSLYSLYNKTIYEKNIKPTKLSFLQNWEI